MNCDKCDGECCKNIAIQIENPETKEDFEDLKWYLYHEGLIVYIDNEDDWLVQIPIKCKFLEKGKCMIYDKRPPICKNSEVSNCEKNIKEAKIIFKNDEDVENYIKSLKSKTF